MTRHELIVLSSGSGNGAWAASLPESNNQDKPKERDSLESVNLESNFAPGYSDSSTVEPHEGSSEAQQISNSVKANKMSVDIDMADSVDPLQLTREGRLGRGGAGNVIKATDPASGRVVAVKLVPLNMKAEHTEGFLKRLRDLYNSRHPNIASFHGAAYDVARSEMVIAFEYMDQRSLKDVINRCTDRKIPEDIMGCCAGQVVSGLHYLHDQRRVIHRDIKPSNILVNSKGQCKLTDFGMARELHTFDAGHTWVGTSSYMSPERVGGESYSFSADIWSLGVLVFEACTGHSPYEGTAQFEILDRIVDGDPPALPATFSGQAVDFVHLCTKKVPAERPGTDVLLTHPFLTINAGANIVSWLASLPADNHA